MRLVPLLLLVLTACQGGKQIASRTLDVSTELGEWKLDPFTQEFPLDERVRGRIALDVRAQELSFRLHEGDRDRSFTWNTRLAIPDWMAATFTQLSRDEILLGGHDARRGMAALVRLRYGLDGEVTAEVLSWKGPEALVACALAPFPDRQHVAVLDHVSNRLFVYDLSSLRSEEIAAAHEADGLLGARHVHVFPIEDHPGGMMVWATEVDAEGLNLGRLIGKSLRAYDLDGDGRFETVE